jgi:hypothetical protein
MFYYAPCGQHPVGTIPKCDACKAMEKAAYENRRKMAAEKLGIKTGGK